MSIGDVLKASVEQIFTVFNEAVHLVTYESSIDDGFGTVTISSIPNVELLVVNFTANDMKSISFADLVQPSDLKGCVRGASIPSLGVNCRFKEGSTIFSVIAYDLDPFGVLYTILLRRVE